MWCEEIKTVLVDLLVIGKKFCPNFYFLIYLKDYSLMANREQKKIIYF